MIQQVQYNGETIIPSKRGVALVLSKSTPDLWHLVNSRDPHCDCKGYQYRGTCRHVETVRAFFTARRTHQLPPAA